MSHSVIMCWTVWNMHHYLNPATFISLLKSRPEVRIWMCEFSYSHVQGKPYTCMINLRLSGSYLWGIMNVNILIRDIILCNLVLRGWIRVVLLSVLILIIFNIKDCICRWQPCNQIKYKYKYVIHWIVIRLTSCLFTLRTPVSTVIMCTYVWFLCYVTDST